MPSKPEPGGAKPDPVEVAISKALDLLYAVSDGAVVLVSISDENGNTEAICDHIGNRHTIDGLAREFGWDGFRVSMGEPEGSQQSEGE